MHATHEEFLETVQELHDIFKSASIDDILDVDYLTSVISKIGLYNEGDRRHPQNNDVHLYGNDVKYMNSMPNTGMWQIPRQLAEFLIKLVSLGKVETFLDIGTCRGATITVVAMFLMRFGLKRIDTIDVIQYLNIDLKRKWEELNLPIHYLIIPQDSPFNLHVELSRYDVIFVDGHHDYKYVLNDFNIAKTMTNKICFHDINDYFCVDVVRLWKEIKDSGNYKNAHEFTHHSHNYKLMGIGLLEI